MATWRINNSTLLGGEVAGQWQPSHSYSLGARCVCRVTYGTTAARAYVYECTTAGTSGSSEPTWPTTPGNTVNDGDVVWTCRQSNDGNWNNAHPIAWYLTAYNTNIAAGDTILVHYQHNEYADLGSYDYIIQGSSVLGNPIKLYSVDKADDTVRVGAVIGTASLYNSLKFQGSAYSYGICYKAPSLIRLPYAGNGNASWVIEGNGTDDTIYSLSTSSKIQIGGTLSYTGVLILLNAVIRIDNLNPSIELNYNARIKWKGGKLKSTTGLTKLFYTTSSASIIDCSDVDFSQVGAGSTPTSIISVSGGDIEAAVFTRCKLPTDSGFTPISGTWDLPSKGKVIFHHCSGSNKVHSLYEASYEGTVQHEETIIRDGGASDGVTPISWKMASSANTKEPIIALESPPITAWAEAGDQEITIEGIYDGTTNLQTDEVWMDVEYPADASTGLGAVTTSRIKPWETPVDLLGSGASWVTTGMSNPNKFRLNLSISTGKTGPVTARIYLAKPSTTIYIDPMIRFSKGAS